MGSERNSNSFVTLIIAWRFIRSRKQSMLMTLTGIIFGIGFFIITQAQTSGFEKFFIQTILGTDGAILIQDKIQDTLESTLSTGKEGGYTDFRTRNTSGHTYIEGIQFPDKLTNAINQYKGVNGVSEIIRKSAYVSSGFRSQPSHIYGINLDDHLEVSNLLNQIIYGDINNFNTDKRSTIIGTKLAQRLNAKVGDYLLINGQQDSQRFRIAAIFETGVSAIDKKRIYAHLDEVRSLFRHPFGSSILQVGIDNPSLAPIVAAQLEYNLEHSVVSWQEREQAWLNVFYALRISSAVTVSTIILLSGLGMFNTLAMMVMEKTREIAILRSTGYQRSDIYKIFLWQGAIVLLTGTVIGWLFGAVATWGITQIPLRIRGIFSTDHVIVNWDFNHYLAAAAIAAVVVLFASYIPARRAAKLEPGNIIRGSAS